MTPEEIRKTLLASARDDARVLITNMRDGKECIAVGIPKSLSATHVVVSWMTGETIIPLASITDVQIQKRNTQPK